MSKFDDGRVLLREIAELEKELKSNDVVSNSREDRQKRIRNLYKDIVTFHPALALSKNIDNILWKHCFYRKIEDQRKRIRSISAILEKSSKDLSVQPRQIEEYKHMLLKLSSSFNKYLSEISTFYGALLLELEELLRQLLSTSHKKVEDTGVLTSDFSPAAKKDGYLRSIHFCLLFLGDVARYSELHSDARKSKNWNAARSYYLRAKQVLPTIGNPYNQLAVLASYDCGSGSIATEIELNAVYFYCRSILIAQPFQTGVDNLKVIFDKSMRNSGRLGEGDWGNKRGGGGSSALTRFLSNFVQLHGALFSLAIKEAGLAETIAVAASAGAEPVLSGQTRHVLSGDEFQYALGTTPSPTSVAAEVVTAHAAAVAKTSSFMYSLMPDILEDIDKLLSNPQSGLSADILLRVIAICVFSVHISKCEMERKLAVNTDSAHQSPHRVGQEDGNRRSVRTSAESLALIFLFNLINKLSLKVCPLGSTEKPRRGIVLRLLQVFSVFCDWGRENMLFLHSIPSIEAVAGSGSVDSVEGIAAASSDLLRAENRSRSSMRVTFADMKINVAKTFQLSSSIAAVASGVSVDDGSPTKDSALKPPQYGLPAQADMPGGSASVGTAPLSEHIELRGYLPCAAAYETFFQDVTIPTLLTGPLAPAKEGVATTRRLQNLEHFVNHTLVPPPPPKPSDPVLPPSKSNREKRPSRQRDRKGKRDVAATSRHRGDKEKSRGRDKRLGGRKHREGEVSATLTTSETTGNTKPNASGSRESRHSKRERDRSSGEVVREGADGAAGMATRQEAIYKAALAAAGGGGTEGASRRRREDYEEDEEERGGSSDELDSDSDSDSDSGSESDNGDESSDESGASEQESHGEEIEDATEEVISTLDSPVAMKPATAALHNDDTDYDEIIVFKPAFSVPFRDQLAGHHTQRNVSTPLAISEDAETLEFLQALHTKNTSLDGWLSRPLDNELFLGANIGSRETGNDSMDFGGLFGASRGNMSSERHADDSMRKNDAWNSSSIPPSQLGYGGPPPGFPDVPPGFHDNATTPQQMKSAGSMLAKWTGKSDYDSDSGDFVATP